MSTAEPVAGRIGRRRALPSGRAVAGGFSVALAAVVLFGSWLGTRPRPAHLWVVTGRALAAGTRLAPSDLTTASLDLGSGPAAASAFASVDGLVGRTLAVSVGPGELVEHSELVGGGSLSDSRPVPVSVSAADLVDLAPGDLVDVLVTSGDGSGGHTTLVVRGAVVRSTDQPSSGLLGSGSADVVTLGVASLSEVEAVVAAERAGTVDLVVGSRSDGAGLGPPAPHAGR